MRLTWWGAGRPGWGRVMAGTFAAVSCALALTSCAAWQQGPVSITSATVPGGTPPSGGAPILHSAPVPHGTASQSLDQIIVL